MMGEDIENEVDYLVAHLFLKEMHKQTGMLTLEINPLSNLHITQNGPACQAFF